MIIRFTVSAALATGSELCVKSIKMLRFAKNWLKTGFVLGFNTLGKALTKTTKSHTRVSQRQNNPGKFLTKADYKLTKTSHSFTMTGKWLTSLCQ